VEINNLKGYDVTRGSEFLGNGYLSNSYFKVNTTNSKNGWDWLALTAPERTTGSPSQSRGECS